MTCRPRSLQRQRHRHRHPGRAAPSERRPRSVGGSAGRRSVAPWRRGGVAAGSGPKPAGGGTACRDPTLRPGPSCPFPGRHPRRKVQRALALVWRRCATPGDVRDGKGRSFNGTNTVPRVFVQTHKNRLRNYSNDSATADRRRSFLERDAGQARHTRPAAPLTVRLRRAPHLHLLLSETGTALAPPSSGGCDETREPFRTLGGRP